MMKFKTEKPEVVILDYKLNSSFPDRRRDKGA